jgi:tetratricopeptide (TPR) repeat protein/predicted Ser/Thr protein kinase
MINLKPGDTLQQRYKIIELLGEGGFGAVYLAEHVRLQGRRLALKVSFDNSRDAEQQFLFEASTLANLHHPGLPSVSDSFVETGGQLFLVMEYIEGQDLTDVIIKRRGPVSEDEAVNWMSQICEAVAYLHEQPKPIIHRDIKPPNIKIMPDGRAVLVDFGIAKQFNPGKRTAKIAKAFSPGFSPVEQYIGTTDARTDVYALGATLYCLLTAKIPPDAFQERFTESIPLPPLRQINPQVSPGVEKVVMKAMAMEPRYRYANAREMLNALRGGAASSTGARCPRCGHTNRPGVRFCVRDGTPLVHVVTPPLPAARPAPKPTHATDAAAAHQHNAQGLKYSKAGQLPQALQAYAKAVQLDPQNAVYHYNLASAYQREDNLHNALQEAQLAESLDAQDADFPLLVGRIYHSLKQYTQAAAALERAIQRDPQNASLYGELGEICFDQGEALPALNAFIEASKLEPDNPLYLFRLAQLFYKADLLDEAKTLAQGAAKLAPDLAPTHNLLGMILFAAGEYKAAIKAQEEAMRLNPKDPVYPLNVALGYLAIGQKSKARQMAQKALSLNPKNQDAKELLRKI